ncbi:MAG: tRNA 2-thiouridine(34) synthase MnmA [Pseudomonadota bacterium]
MTAPLHTAPAWDGTVNSLGFAKPPAQTRVVAAMSGGVDSSVVAALLADQGYEVVGITLQLYDHGEAIRRKGACCAGQDIHDARNVADQIGIPHYVLDYESRFKDQVMDDFADTYLAGSTPIPCIRCNQTVKFADLLSTARDLGADCLATGHYIRREVGPDGAQLHRAHDDSRDQSYFLFATTREQMDYLRFPLGGLPKTRVRELADHYNLPVASKPDSQDICFVPDGDYASVVKRLRPGAGRGGDIVHIDGPVLGQHDGVIHYTVGQRRGLGVATGDPLYVVKIDAPARRVLVGPKEALATAGLALDELNWLGTGELMDAAERGTPVLARVRSTRPPVPARLSLKEGAPVVMFDDPEHGVARGQACVLYDPESQTRVFGGGFISATFSAWEGVAD